MGFWDRGGEGRGINIDLTMEHKCLRACVRVFRNFLTHQLRLGMAVTYFPFC